MLKHTIPEAKEALEQIIKVRESYEHRINVVEIEIEIRQLELRRLHSKHQEIETMERSLDYDIDCVINDEAPDGYHINEMYDNEFIMPSMCPCDCAVCRTQAILKKYEEE